MHEIQIQIFLDPGLKKIKYITFSKFYSSTYTGFC